MGRILKDPEKIAKVQRKKEMKKLLGKLEVKGMDRLHQLDKTPRTWLNRGNQQGKETMSKKNQSIQTSLKENL